ncbi:unnamed protein product [Camellia sinensis]
MHSPKFRNNTLSLSLSRRRAASGEFWFGRATSRTMILDKGQLLETEQMFRDAGEKWPVIIPEEEIRQAALGTKCHLFSSLSSTSEIYLSSILIFLEKPTLAAPGFAYRDIVTSQYLHTFLSLL